MNSHDMFEKGLVTTISNDKMKKFIHLKNLQVRLKLNIHWNIYDVIDLEIVWEEGLYDWLFIDGEDVRDHKSLLAAHLLTLNIRRLVLLVRRLAQKLADLVQEPIFVIQFVPSLDAKDQVKTLFSG